MHDSLFARYSHTAVWYLIFNINCFFFYRLRVGNLFLLSFFINWFVKIRVVKLLGYSAPTNFVRWDIVYCLSVCLVWLLSSSEKLGKEGFWFSIITDSAGTEEWIDFLNELLSSRENVSVSLWLSYFCWLRQNGRLSASVSNLWSKKRMKVWATELTTDERLRWIFISRTKNTFHTDVVISFFNGLGFTPPLHVELYKKLAECACMLWSI